MPSSSIRSARGPLSGRWSVAVAILFVLAAGAVAACQGGDEAPDGTGAELAKRWLRAGEDNTANVVLYERALPPYLVDLLNPSRTADTPADDLISFPVHPDGKLLGSYVLRRASGAQIVWLFYDVPETSISEVESQVSTQLDASPWQVVGQQGNRSNRLVTFQSTRTEDISGNAIVEAAPPSGSFTLTVEREGERVTIEIPRAASAPLVEAAFDDDLVVERVFPGFARVAGLSVDDRVVRAGDADVSTREGLRRALADLAEPPLTVALLYVLQFAPPPGVETPPFLPARGLTLPEAFPAQDAWVGLELDEFQSSTEAQGESYLATFFTEDSITAVADRVRDGLEAAGWEIASDDAVGLGTMLQFEHAGEALAGAARIDVAPQDDSLTIVVVQIQTAQPSGN